MRRSIYNIIKTTHSFSIDSLLSFIAPHSCLGCGQVGSTLCSHCLELVVSPPPPRCFNCQMVSSTYRICTSCKRFLSVDSIVHAGPYDGIHKQLVLTMKKSASRATSHDIAAVLSQLYHEVGYLSECDIVVPVPTIRSHIRERSFDHTKEIARSLALTIDLPCYDALQRTSETRQVGKTRKERFSQMENGVKYKGVKKLNGVKVLLVDDIATTGATLSACARALKDAGALRVDAVVFASGN